MAREAKDVAAENLAAVEARDRDRLRATYAEGAVLEAPGAHFEGSDQIAEYVMTWLRAFPDGRQTVTNQLVAGDWVVQEFTFTGTHTGTLVSPDGEIPATGRALSGQAVSIFRVAGGQIVEERLYFDQVDFLTQLGVLPEPAAV